MKAVVRRSLDPGDVALLDVVEPQPRPGEVKIRMEYAGICGSDGEVYHQRLPAGGKRLPPVAMGHEGVGRVVELGNGVTHLQPGDRVVADSTVRTCGVCRQCRDGYLQLCSKRISLGSRIDGTFAEYIVARAAGCYKIAEDVDPLAAAVAEPLACATNALLRNARLIPGDIAVVFGPGAIGQTAAQVAHAAGAQVVLVGTPHSRQRLEVGLHTGLDHTLVAGEVDVQAEIMNITSGEGADVAVVATSSPLACGEAINCLQRTGQLVLLAAGPQPPLFDTAAFMRKQLRMSSAISHDDPSWQFAVNLINQHRVNLRPLVSDVYPLDQWETALTRVERHEGLKVLLQP